MITAYTFPYNSIQNRIIIGKCFVTLPGNPPDDSTPEHKALWDTGAMLTCISNRLANDMKLVPTDYTSVKGANNEPFEVPYYDIYITMGGFALPFQRVVGLPMDNDYDLIIGMDIITKGDLSITNFNGRTVISFRTPSLESINYCHELSLFDKCKKMHNFNVNKKLSDKCACGSGKDYKNCHGKSPYNKNV